MARLIGALIVAMVAATGSASAQDVTFEPLKPLDLAQVSPEMAADLFGPYDIIDKTGRKKCRIVLKRGPTIGGMEIEVAPGCAKTFPVMDEITAWRVLENWTIDLADATCKTRVRFETPDSRYVAIPTVDGIDGLNKIEAAPARRAPAKR